MLRSVSVLVLPIFFFVNCFSSHGSGDKKTDDAEEAGEMRQSTLRYVWLVTRHGTRSPLYTYPGDPYPCDNVTFWPDGKGELTKFGKKQMYAVGRLLRERYDSFLSANYYADEIYVESAYNNRDIMSALALLAGLYPPVGFQIWNENLAWQPIPIHVSNGSEYPTRCPRYFENYNRFLREPNVPFPPELANILKYLNEMTGLDDYELMSKWIADLLLVEAENGFELPAWAAQIPRSDLEALQGFVCSMINLQTNEQIRLLAGPMLEMILERLNSKAEGTMNPDIRMYILANHDSMLYGLLKALNVTEVTYVAMSSFLAFELHENSYGHFVKVFYFRNGTIATPLELDMPLCQNPCSLKGFKDAVENYIPEDWNSECNSNGIHETAEKTIKI